MNNLKFEQKMEELLHLDAPSMLKCEIMSAYLRKTKTSYNSSPFHYNIPYLGYPYEFILFRSDRSRPFHLFITFLKALHIPYTIVRYEWNIIEVQLIRQDIHNGLFI
jgi:hypothetical protein